MTVQQQADLRRQIVEAFASVPHPGDDHNDISLTKQDEGIVAYFRGTPRLGHSATTLRHHVVALSFFTPEALRYWLPAFMLAELDDPDEADTIVDTLIGVFAGSSLWPYSAAQLRAIELFVEEYVRRYGEDRDSKRVLRRLRARLRNASAGG